MNQKVAASLHLGLRVRRYLLNAYLRLASIAEMIVPKSASVIGPFPPATNGSLLPDASWPSVIGHRWSCRPMTNADFGTIISAIMWVLLANVGMNKV